MSVTQNSKPSTQNSFCMDKFQILSKSANDTIKIAHAVAPCFHLGDVLVLDGDLGTGKTQFVKGFSDALGSTNLVTSPTFTIAQFYNSPVGALLHIDTYRMSGIAEFRDTGLSDFFGQSIVLIEWGSKIADELEDFIVVQFEHLAKNKDHRTITFSYQGAARAEQFQSIIQKLSNL